MAQDLLHHPHDTLFKSAYSDKEVMIDFLRSRLPRKLFKLFDLPTLQLTNKSFVSKGGKHTHGDLIYKVRLKGHVEFMYIALEHFSEPDRYILLRHLEYNMGLFRQHLKEGRKKLPFVLNIAVCTGDDSYEIPKDLMELFDYSVLVREYWPEGFRINFPRDEDTRILRDRRGALAALLLKRGKKGDFRKLLDKYGKLLKKKGISYVEEALLYILARDNRENTLEKLKEITSSNYQGAFMSIAKKLVEQGKRQGRQEGRQEGKQEGMRARTLDIARGMLYNLHLEIDVIQQATGLSREAILSIEAEGGRK